MVILERPNEIEDVNATTGCQVAGRGIETSFDVIVTIMKRLETNKIIDYWRNGCLKRK